MKSFKKLGLGSVAMTTFPYQHPQHPSQPVAAKNSFLLKLPSEDTELYKLILANEKALSSKAGPKLFVTRFFFFFLVLRRKTESMWTVTDALYYGIPWRLEDYSWLPKLYLTHSRDADENDIGVAVDEFSGIKTEGQHMAHGGERLLRGTCQSSVSFRHLTLHCIHFQLLSISSLSGLSSLSDCYVLFYDFCLSGFFFPLSFRWVPFFSYF